MYVLYLGANGTLKRLLELINASQPAPLGLGGAEAWFGRRACMYNFTPAYTLSI